MGNIEHLIGIRRADGYDEADVRELVESLNARPSVAFAVELTEPAATQGIVQAGQMLRDAITLVADWEDRDAAADTAVKAWDACLSTIGEESQP